MLWVIIEFVVFLSATVLALFIIQEDPGDLKNYWLFITVVLLGIGIARRAISHNREKVQFKYATKLAEFIDSGNVLRLKIDEDPLPIEEHNDWIAEIETYLRKSRKPHCVTRLSDFSGMTFYGDGSDRSKFRNSIDGRVRRLHEFIRDANV